ncbi:MAG: acyl carrier protein [Catenulispora sp.]
MTAVDPGPEIAGFLKSSFPGLAIADEDDIFARGIANSLFTIQLIIFIEQRFALAIPNSELELDNFRTVKAMTALVERLVRARADV